MLLRRLLQEDSCVSLGNLVQDVRFEEILFFFLLYSLGLKLLLFFFFQPLLFLFFLLWLRFKCAEEILAQHDIFHLSFLLLPAFLHLFLRLFLSQDSNNVFLGKALHIRWQLEHIVLLRDFLELFGF